MKTIRFEISIDIEDDFAEETKRWEHHANELLDLESYPEIKGVYGCKVTEKERKRNNDEKI